MINQTHRGVLVQKEGDGIMIAIGKAIVLLSTGEAAVGAGVEVEVGAKVVHHIMELPRVGP